ncbi:MAG: peptidoglycan editing factor PgeF [Bacillota bacterium]
MDLSGAGDVWQFDSVGAGVPVLRLRPFEEAGCLALFTLRPLSMAGALRGREAVLAARASLQGCLPRSPFTVHQVHGGRVVYVGESPADPGEADGMVTCRPGLPLAVFCADCAPVYLYDPRRRAIGLLHAGWRGTVAGVVEQGLATMARTAGSDPAHVLAAVGPCIGPCCYEIGDDVRCRVEERLGEDAGRVLSVRDGRLYFDLRGAIVILLERSGVPSTHIFGSGMCTACRSDLFWSHRRDGGVTGRMAAVLALLA